MLVVGPHRNTLPDKVLHLVIEPALLKEMEMPDDKQKSGAAHRRMVSEAEDYELRYFARKHNIPLAEARRLLKLHGNSRAKLERG
jgi:hypothetical protein